jgi:hypothetical protein
MYLFRIKADALDIDIPAARSLLTFAVIVLVLSRNEHIVAVNITCGMLLLLAGLFTEMIMVKFKVNLLILTGAAAVLLAIATQHWLFPLCLMIIAVGIKYSYVQPSVEIAEKGIRIKKSFSAKNYEWTVFNNIILKDGLLTLDFKNNKVLQLELDTNTEANEKQFNDFCSQKIIR